MLKTTSHRDGRPGERSFTLAETVIALSIIAVVVTKVVDTQASVVYNTTYIRNVNQAMWLAKRLMSQVEYYWHKKDLKQLESDGDVKGAEFQDMGPDFPFTYNLEIKEWKLPLFELLQSGGPKDPDAEESETQSQESSLPIRDLVKPILGDDILKTAHVEVMWPEGAKKNSVSLTYLLTNQRAADAYLQGLQPDYQKLLAKMKQEINPVPKTKAECQSNEFKAKYKWVNNKCVKRTNNSGSGGNNRNTGGNSGRNTGGNSGSSTGGGNP